MDITDYTLVLHPDEDDPNAIEPDSISVPPNYDNPRASKSNKKSTKNYSGSHTSNVPNGNPHYITMEDYLQNMESSYNRSRLNQWINQIANDDLGYDQSPYTRSLNFDGLHFYWT